MNMVHFALREKTQRSLTQLCCKVPMAAPFDAAPPQGFPKGDALWCGLTKQQSCFVKRNGIRAMHERSLPASGLRPFEAQPHTPPFSIIQDFLKKVNLFIDKLEIL
ncbi:MAG: hypothetical protein K2N56_08350 [Oscillospiraceae bacterium]|nr:hypothetical protein [Oscillospiraceae bacterium]